MTEHSDGSIIIDADFDTEGFASGTKRMERAVKGLTPKINATFSNMKKAALGNIGAMSDFQTQAQAVENEIGRLEKGMEMLGDKRIPTDDYKWVTAEIEKAENAVDRLSARQSKMQATGVKENSKAYQSLQYDIEQARRKLDDLLATKQILENSGQASTLGADTGEYQRLAADLDAARQRLAELRAEAAQTGTEVSSSWSQMTTMSGMLRGTFSSAFSDIRSAASTVGTAVMHPIQTADRLLGTIITKAMQAASALRSMAAAGLQKLVSGLKQIASHVAKAALSFLGLSKNMKSANGGLSSGFKTLLKYGLGVRSLYALVNKLRSALVSGFQNLAQYSDSTNQAISSVSSALAQLKNSFATAFAPVLTVVTPILARLINMLSTAVTYIGMFFAALTGAKTFTKATAVQQDYAASLNGTASAAKSAADAEKEAATQLAAFDEINVLSDNAADNSGSGGGGADVGSMFEEVPIESSVASFVSRIKEAFVNGEYAEIGHIIGEGVNRAFQKIHDFIKWDNIGATLTYYIEAFCAIFNSLTDAVNWNMIGSTFAEGINTIVNSLYLLLTGIDWTALGAAFSKGLNGLIQNVDWEKFGSTIGEFFNAKLHLLYGAITNFDWAAAGSALAEAVNGIAQSIDWATFGSSLSSGIIGAFTFLRTTITEIDWNQLGQDVGTFISNIDWGGIIGTALTVLLSLPKTLYDLLCGAISSTDWVGIAAGIVDGIITAVTNFDYKGTFTSLGELWGSALKAALDIAKWLGEAISEGVEDAKSYFADKIEECGGDVVAGIFKGILDALKNIGKWIWENVFKPIRDGFCDAFGIHSPSTVMAELGGYLIDGLLNGTSETWSTITAFFDESIEAVKTAFSDAWDSAKTTASTKWDDIQATLSGAWDGVKTTAGNKFADVVDEISGVWEGVKEDASGWGGDICSNLASGISGAISTVTSAVSTVASKISSYLHFSEPDIGPLSNFHTYMPDMLALMAEGIKSNTYRAVDAVSALASKMLDPVSGIAGEIADEFDTGSYTVPKIGIGGVTGALDGFATEISNSFSHLVDTLNAIAERVTFTVPVVATGTIIPRNLRTEQSNQTSRNSIEAPEDLIRKIVREEAGGSNTELLQAILEAIRAGQVIKVNETVLGRTSAKAINKLTQSSGKPVLLF